VRIRVDALIEAAALSPIRTQLDTWAANSAEDRSAAAWLVLRDHVDSLVVLDCVYDDAPLIWVRLFGELDPAELEGVLPTVQADARVIRQFPAGLEVLVGHPDGAWPAPEILDPDDRAGAGEQESTIRVTLAEPDETETQAGFVSAVVDVEFTETLTFSAIASAADSARAADWRDNLMAIAFHAARTPSLAVAGIGDLIGDADVSQSANTATFRVQADAQQTARIVDLLVEIVASELE
jgi:hypothetical protein